jgi:hypothetical protein
MKLYIGLEQSSIWTNLCAEIIITMCTKIISAYNFSTGAYKDKVYSGQYGDLAATVAAILLEPEARSVMLDYDPTFGRLREPLLKVVASLSIGQYIIST